MLVAAAQAKVLGNVSEGAIAIEAVRMDEVFAIEREVNGFTAAARFIVRQERLGRRAQDFETWLREERASLSSKTPSRTPSIYSLNAGRPCPTPLDDRRLPMPARCLDGGTR
jgi:transposase